MREGIGDEKDEAGRRLCEDGGIRALCELFFRVQAIGTGIDAQLSLGSCMKITEPLVDFLVVLVGRLWNC